MKIQYHCLRCGEPLGPNAHCCNCSRSYCPKCEPEPTHERNVLVWLAGKPRLAFTIGAIILALAVLLSAGCKKSPTSPNDFSHPNEILIDELTQCYAEYHDIKSVVERSGREYRGVIVEFSDTVRWVPCSNGKKGLGPNSTCVAAGWAWPTDMANGIAHITYYGPFVRDECDLCVRATEESHLNESAAHEVAHLAGEWSHGPSFVEKFHDGLKNAGCF